MARHKEKCDKNTASKEVEEEDDGPSETDSEE